MYRTVFRSINYFDTHCISHLCDNMRVVCLPLVKLSTDAEVRDSREADYRRTTRVYGRITA